MDEIKGIARVRFLPGKVEEWKRLTEQAVEIVRTRDRGTLQYEIFFNQDESEAIVFERYRDADAAIEHFSNIGHLMAPLMATASVTGEVLGTPNAKMRAQLGKGEPKLFTPWMALQDQSAASPRAPGRRPARPARSKRGRKPQRRAK
jgi:quinol monooxygenase YgiN